VTQAYLLSRIYSGYADPDPAVSQHPEPYAYESAFSVKWLLEDHITQWAGGASGFPLLGDLTELAVPWTAWGPYLWADGQIARQDGLTWDPQDFQADGTHPSLYGEKKVGEILLEFIKNSAETTAWGHA
jgi:hypothetical protein